MYYNARELFGVSMRRLQRAAHRYVALTVRELCAAPYRVNGYFAHLLVIISSPASSEAVLNHRHISNLCLPSKSNNIVVELQRAIQMLSRDDEFYVRLLAEIQMLRKDYKVEYMRMYPRRRAFLDPDKTVFLFSKHRAQ